MVETNHKSITDHALAHNPKRDATDSFRGYVYQVYQSTQAWIKLGDDDCLFLECAEDFDVHTNDYIVATQVKDTKIYHTLRTPEIRDAIDNFWSHTTNNQLSDVRFRYLSTSEITKEKGLQPHVELPGLTYWREVALGNSDPEPLRKFLLENQLKNSDLIYFLTNASPDELRERLFQRIEWDFSQKKIEPLLNELRSDIVIPASTQNINAIEASGNILVSVIHHVVNLLSKPGEKILTKSELFSVIAKAGHKTLTNANFETLLAQAGSVDKNPTAPERCPITWVHGSTEDGTYVPRLGVMSELDLIVSNKNLRTATAFGIAGHGKTSLVGHWLNAGRALTTGRFKQAFFWSFYSDRDVEKLIIRLIADLDPDAGISSNNFPRNHLKNRSSKSNERNQLTPIEIFSRKASQFPPCLIVLDGVEVLQHRLNEGVNYGRFVDSRLQILLEEVARLKSPWLIVCTSRFPLTDRIKYASDRHIELGPLKIDEGVQLLELNGVRGSNFEIERVVKALQAHPLALKIFAASLPTELIYEPKRHLVAILGPYGDEMAVEQKVIRLVHFYSQSIENIQRLLLLSLSIFRTPVPLKTISSVANSLAPKIGLNSSPVTHLAANLAKLASSGIVICDNISTGIVSYSCHPVILDSFRRDLLNQPAGEDAIELLVGRPDDFTLEGVSELEPLIIAFEALLEIGDDHAAMQIYKDRFETGRIFLRQGLPYEAVRVFESLLYDATNNPANSGTLEKVRQTSAERKYLLPAADFDITLGELHTAGRRLNRALKVSSTFSSFGIYRNFARLKYHEGDLEAAASIALKGASGVESAAISYYYRLRALTCSGEFQEAKHLIDRLRDCRHQFEIADLLVLEPMCKLFLAIRQKGAKADTSAIGYLSKNSESVLDQSRRLEAEMVLCHARVLFQRKNMSRQLEALKREAVTGQFRIRQHQIITLLAYCQWTNGEKVNIDDLKYINSVSADENYFLIQCDCLRVLSLAASTQIEREQYDNQFKMISRSLGYTTAENAFPKRQ